MGFMQEMRTRIRRNSAQSARGKAFRAPGSVGRFTFYSIVAAISLGYGVRVLADDGGDPPLNGYLAMGMLFSLFAIENFRRLKSRE